MRVTVNSIDTTKDYRAALAEMEDLVDSNPPSRSAEAARMHVLGAMLEAYERIHCPISPPDPIEAIRFRLEQEGLDERALIGVMGTRSRVWEVMNRHRPLSLEMIRALNRTFGIPAASLIGSSDSRRRVSE